MVDTLQSFEDQLTLTETMNQTSLGQAPDSSNHSTDYHEHENSRLMSTSEDRNIHNHNNNNNNNNSRSLPTTFEPSYKNILNSKSPENSMVDKLLESPSNNKQYNSLENLLQKNYITPGTDPTKTKKDSRDLISDIASGITYMIPFTTSKEGGANLFGSVVNLSNTVMGAGLLGIPYALSHCGEVLGIIMFAIFAILSGLGLYLIMAAAKVMPGSTFSTLCKQTIPKWQIVVDAFIVVGNFGIFTSYLIVIGDLMPDAAAHIMDYVDREKSFWKHRETWITLFLIVLVIPLVHLKKFDLLKYSSAFAILCFFYVMSIIIVYRFGSRDSKLDPCKSYEDRDDCKGAINDYPTSITKFLGVLPIFIFAFCCHMNGPPVAHDLKDNSNNSLMNTSSISIGLCTVVYAFIGICGYKTFGRKAESDILKNYPERWPVTILRMLLSIAVAFSFPVILHPCRESFAFLLFKKKVDDLNIIQFLGCTYFLVICSFIISLFVKDLGLVLALVGATNSTLQSYVLPGIYYYQLFKPNSSISRRNNRHRKRKMNVFDRMTLQSSLFMAVLGFLIMIVCTVAIIIGD